MSNNRVRSAFTLMELLVTSILVSGVLALSARFCRNYCLSLLDLSGRQTVLRELRLAQQYLAQDFGPAVGATAMGGNRLLICQDAGNAPDGVAQWGSPDVLVEYCLTDGLLYRYDYSSDLDVAVASCVQDFAVSEAGESDLSISLTVECAQASRDMSLEWSRP